LVISSEVQVVVARLDAGPHEARALALSLSQAERSRAARFRFEGKPALAALFRSAYGEPQ
jgi:hypothetical protein